MGLTRAINVPEKDRKGNYGIEVITKADCAGEHGRNIGKASQPEDGCHEEDNAGRNTEDSVELGTESAFPGIEPRQDGGSNGGKDRPACREEEKVHDSWSLNMNSSVQCLPEVIVGYFPSSTPDAGDIGHQTELDDREGKTGTQQGPESDMKRQHVDEISR